MIQAAARHLLYFAVAACSIAAVAAGAESGAADEAFADRRIAVRTLGHFDNAADVAALVSSQIAR